MTVTPLARKVYRIVSRIPIGQVRTYKWVAEKAGNPGASRAVGQILKRNPYPLIIPCHRVIKSDNKVGGYALGVNKKKQFLKIEKEILECLGTRK